MASNTACNVNCLTSLVPKRYNAVSCDPANRAWGSDTMVWFHCTLTANASFNLLDTLAWDAGITSDLIIKTPCGAYEEGEASENVSFTTGCGVDRLDASEVPWTFETDETADNRTDETWWFRLDKGWDAYTAGYISCDGVLYIGDLATTQALDNSNYIVAAGTAIGHSMSKVKRPKFEQGSGGRGKNGLWRMGGSYETKCVQRGIEVPGLATSLAAA